MTEILVLTACLYSKGCSEAANVYYDSKPEIREAVFKVENQIKATAGPFFVSYVAPVLVFGAGGTGSIKVSKLVTLKLERQSGTLIFKKDF